MEAVLSVSAAGERAASLQAGLEAGEHLRCCVRLRPGRQVPPGARCAGWTQGLPLLQSLAALGCSQCTELGFLTFASVTMLFKYCVPSMKLWEGRGGRRPEPAPSWRLGPGEGSGEPARSSGCVVAALGGEDGAQGRPGGGAGPPRKGGPAVASEELCGVRMSAAVTGCGRPQQVG